MASTFFFLFLYLLTKNVTLSILLGMALGAAQIGWEFARKKPIDSMQWISLFVVLATGTTALLTDDPRFVMIKPSVIYAIVGIVMLKPGWMNRYLPPIAIELVPDIAVIFGYVWAGLMFFSAALNLIVALNFSVVTWSAALRMIRFPVGMLPVKLMSRGIGLLTRASPTVSPGPVTTLRTPGGTPASSPNLANSRAESGVSSCGLRTMLLPAISAGAILRMATADGKFQGMIPTTTPTGAGTIHICSFRFSDGRMSPSIRRSNSA